MSILFVLGASAVVVAIVVLLFVASRMVRYVGNNRVAIVEKMWSRSGSIGGGLIAMEGEAGYQPDVLRGGFTSSCRSSTASTPSRW